MIAAPGPDAPVPDVEWVRGTCVRCESDQVLHHVIGLPMVDVVESSPSWVVWEGCTGLGPDRECLTCDATWWVDEHGYAEPWEFEENYGDEDEDTPGTETEPPLRVVGAVITDGDHVLAARRRSDLRHGGLWEFPGGKIEMGESPQQALRRELREELGAEVEIGWLIGRGVSWAGEQELHLDCYWARLAGPAPQESTDHDALAWLTVDDLPGRQWPEADQPILEQIMLDPEPRFTPAR